MNISIQHLMDVTGVKFGTSGARGLVKDMTDQVCYAYTIGFIQYLERKGELVPTSTIAVAGDLRPSTPRIMRAVMKAITDRGYSPINCGFIPSPAVALYGLMHKVPAIMVTGSHIPTDRNGIKFNKTAGEILKNDEAEIRSQLVMLDETIFDEKYAFINPPASNWDVDPTAKNEYMQRYLQFFDQNALNGLTIGVYQHSAVGRDILAEVVEKLGATVIPLGRSDTFIPVDTEAIREEDIALAKQWVKEYKLDAIFSTDGDSDRPLLATETGEWIRGDVGGILCARFLKVKFISTPVSCNTAVEKCGWFSAVNRTKIGSPYVIENMIETARQNPDATVVGYEANGGFLIQTPIAVSEKTLRALPTRDAFIYLIAITLLAKQEGKTLSQLVAGLPDRYTCSDRLQNFPQELSKKILGNFAKELPPEKISSRIEKAFGKIAGDFLKVDYTDGVQITFKNDEIIHLRPSGNAPEFRCYTEAASKERVAKLNAAVMNWLRNQS